MTEEDFAGILPLQHEIQKFHEAGRPDLFRTGAVSYPEKIFRETVNDPAWRCAVCEADGEIAGFLFAWVRRLRDHRNMRDADILLLDDICVGERFRRQGVGHALFDYAQAAAEEAGCDRIELSVWSFNEDAAAFYRAMGLVPMTVKMEKKTEKEAER
ncbi:MAG: GNAT family N-acetyltransferase [Clostridia bacterium]|nr:GNAT family N-acetyltransferase [Clostridia bacterium]